VSKAVLSKELINIFVSIAQLYKHEYTRRVIMANVERYAFEYSLVYRCGGVLVDVGAGNGALALACKVTGMEHVTVIEDFGDPWHDDAVKTDIVSVLRSSGVHVILRNALTLDLPFPDNSVDCVSSIDCLEHWPHSPAHLFSEIKRVLKPGGRFVLGAPNAVSVIKRMRVLIGKTNYPPWKDFYEQVRWRGHVREPTLGELFEIMGTLGLEVVYTVGRNWMALRKGYRGLTLKVVRMAIPLLNLFPTLCSDLYVVGRKPI
jgi:SAM-dependent methyltransferase